MNYYYAAAVPTLALGLRGQGAYGRGGARGRTVIADCYSVIHLRSLRFSPHFIRREDPS